VTARQWLRQRPLFYYWIPLIAWMGLIFFLSAQPDFPRPGVDWLGELIGIGVHTLLFGALAILWARLLAGRRHPLLLAFLLTMVYALSDEFHQSFVPGRHADPLDLVWDGLGAVLALWAWAWLQSRSARAPEKQTP
jgi:VanZ family protein